MRALDGMYLRGIDGAPEFVEVPEPIDEALQAVLHQLINRLMKLLTRQGVLIEEEGSPCRADNDSDSDEARVLRPTQALTNGRRAAGRCPTTLNRDRHSGQTHKAAIGCHWQCPEWRSQTDREANPAVRQRGS